MLLPEKNINSSLWLPARRLQEGICESLHAVDDVVSRFKSGHVIGVSQLKEKTAMPADVVSDKVLTTFAEEFDTRALGQSQNGRQFEE